MAPLQRLGRALAPWARALQSTSTSLSLPPHLSGPATTASVDQSRNFFRVVDQYEEGPVFTLGKLTAVKKPGFRLVIPMFQKMHKIDMRAHKLDVPSQHLMSGDDVSVRVDAVVFYRIVDAKLAICAVNNLQGCINELAQAHIRDGLSHSTLEHVLHRRHEFSEQIKIAVAGKTRPWGVEIDDVKLKNIRVDESMVRALAKKAEAQREFDARTIIADAEVNTAERLAKAAHALEGPGAMALRQLQTLLEMSQEKGNTVIIVPANLRTLLEKPEETKT